jgi:hypothetical protein
MCKHYDFVMSQEHRHYINSSQHDNCVLCVAETEGPMTQEQVGSYFGVTKERISQIESAALKKLREILDFNLEDLLPDPVLSFTPKSVWFRSNSSPINFLDVQTMFSTEDPIQPYSWRHRACIPR